MEINADDSIPYILKKYLVLTTSVPHSTTAPGNREHLLSLPFFVSTGPVFMLIVL